MRDFGPAFFLPQYHSWVNILDGWNNRSPKEKSLHAYFKQKKVVAACKDLEIIVEIDFGIMGNYRPKP